MARLRREATQELRRRTDQFATLLNGAPMGVYLVGQDFRLRHINPVAMPLFGDIPGLIGRDLGEVLHLLWPGHYADELVRLFRHTLGTGEPHVIPERSERRLDRGTVEVYERHIHRIPLSDGGLGVVCYFRDISAQVKARERLAALNERLADSNRRKDEFLAMLGHELRNPLAALRNAVATAGTQGSMRPKAVGIARRQTEQLSKLVDDLLDVARISQGRITLRKSRVSLTDVLSRAVEDARPFMESRGVGLTITLAPEATWLEADPVRLEQVFVNLMSNAAKYTEPGGRVHVVTARRGAEIDVRVRDTGIGIAPDVLPRVWDLFTQADRALDRSQGGLGIGLTVARRLTELHGGRVAAHSEGLGKGSEFVVTLPVPHGVAAEEQLPAPDLERSSRTVRVLVVEDNPDAAESLAMLLELLGHRVRIAHDGVAGLEVARRDLPDVMLVDIGLPGMDGFEFAGLVRSDPLLRDVPLIALTGYGREEDREKTSAAGFDHHIVKPASPEALGGLIEGIENLRPAR
jgi:PAS domain S-box-containing protein